MNIYFLKMLNFESAAQLSLRIGVGEEFIYWC